MHHTELNADGIEEISRQRGLNIKNMLVVFPRIRKGCKAMQQGIHRESTCSNKNTQTLKNFKRK